MTAWINLSDHFFFQPTQDALEKNGADNVNKNVMIVSDSSSAKLSWKKEHNLGCCCFLFSLYAVDCAYYLFIYYKYL